MLRFCLAAMLAFGAHCATAKAEPVRGAGSSFAYPAIARWSQTFQVLMKGEDFVSTESGIDYEPVGSLAGVMRMRQPETDFAATDSPLSSEDLGKLDGPVTADIFMGRITRWNDPAIRALNPDAPLPDRAIAVVHRSDGSGTTLNFTRFLAARSDAWKSAIGSDTVVRFPTGVGREGSGQVLREVQGTPGAVSYVEFGQALRAGLNYAAVQNVAGAFVAPSAESVQAAAASTDWIAAKDFQLYLTDAPGTEAYPIAATAFALMPRTQRSSTRIRRTLLFFRHALDDGAADAAALGYVPLPAPLITQVRQRWQAAYDRAARF